VVLIKGTTFNVVMTSSDKKLQEVVVTALGIARDRRSLGYASQNLKGEELATGEEVILAMRCKGKLQALILPAPVGGAGAASVNINIRGISSFTGSNQPLFVIDGIPVSNDVE